MNAAARNKCLNSVRPASSMWWPWGGVNRHAVVRVDAKKFASRGQTLCWVWLKPILTKSNIQLLSPTPGLLTGTSGSPGLRRKKTFLPLDVFQPTYIPEFKVWCVLCWHRARIGVNDCRTNRKGHVRTRSGPGSARLQKLEHLVFPDVSFFFGFLLLSDYQSTAFGEDHAEKTSFNLRRWSLAAPKSATNHTEES